MKPSFVFLFSSLLYSSQKYLSCCMSLCAVLHATCHCVLYFMSHVIVCCTSCHMSLCAVLHATCHCVLTFMSHVMCAVLHATSLCAVLHVACHCVLYFMPHVMCTVLHVTCHCVLYFMPHVIVCCTSWSFILHISASDYACFQTLK